MEMSGKKLAEPVLEGIKKKIAKLGEKNIIPELAIVTVGGEDAWFSYVTQKLKTAQRLGIKTRALHLSGRGEEELVNKVKQLNNDKNVNGVIIQRPLPNTFDRERVVNSINPVKDIDGFRSDSPYQVPVVLALRDFIKLAFGVLTASELKKTLINQSICVVGKGETAGGPTTKWLHTQGAVYNIIDTKTQDPCQVLKEADLIITATGKPNIIKKECLKEGVVLIGIGIRHENGKLMGDFDIDEIKPVAKAWTPTPGGVGPLNLSYLFQNLVEATEKQTHTI